MVAVADIAYVVYDHPDLDEAERFYRDFGLVTAARRPDELLMRGADGQPYCYVARKADRPRAVAIGMRVNSREDLERAAREEGVEMEPIDCLGGGWRVRLASPMGVDFELVHGCRPLEPLPMRDPLVLNHASNKARRGQWQRAVTEPAQVLRLGHVALVSSDFKSHAQWLQQRLGMKPSDILYDGTPDNALGGFFHCTGGDDWVDHHTIALFPAPVCGIHHASFEVQDFDAQFHGNKFLLAQGRKPLWGVGRHILGSQVFDYWFDPQGNVVEHFTDGDLVRPGKAPDYHQVADDSLAQWGPPISVQAFIERRPPPGAA